MVNIYAHVKGDNMKIIIKKGTHPWHNEFGWLNLTILCDNGEDKSTLNKMITSKEQEDWQLWIKGTIKLAPGIKINAAHLYKRDTSLI